MKIISVAQLAPKNVLFRPHWDLIGPTAPKLPEVDP